jgi:hypothetical protein
MKRKTIIILAGVYLGIVAVIVLVSVLFKDNRLSLAEVDDQTEATPVSESGFSGTSTKDVVVEEEILPNATAIQSTPTDVLEVATVVVTSTEITQITETTVLIPTLTPTSNNNDIVPSQTPVPTNTIAPTPTATPAPTSTPQTIWEGEWTAYFEQSNGLYQSGLLTVTLDNEGFIVASAVIGGFNYNFKGNLNADQTAVNGLWTSSSISGKFYWVLAGDEQFGGNINTLYGFCGARVGLEQPFPCHYQPPR